MVAVLVGFGATAGLVIALWRRARYERTTSSKSSLQLVITFDDETTETLLMSRNEAFDHALFLAKLHRQPVLCLLGSSRSQVITSIKINKLKKVYRSFVVQDGEEKNYLHSYDWSSIHEIIVLPLDRLQKKTVV
jgi:DNA polymerase elongation subunit (family B)